MTISWEDYDRLMKVLQLTRRIMHQPLTLGSLTQGHLPICQVHNPYLLAYPNYHNLHLFLLRMVMFVLLWNTVRPIRPPHSSYLKSFMFPISLSTSYLSTQSPKHYFAPSHSFLTSALFRICRLGRGLVWGVRLDVDFMSLSLIIF